jgi:hypothetical protein
MRKRLPAVGISTALGAAFIISNGAFAQLAASAISTPAAATTDTRRHETLAEAARLLAPAVARLEEAAQARLQPGAAEKRRPRGGAQADRCSQQVMAGLNREKLPVPKKADFAAISKRLSLNLSIRKCRERDGMALRGFYVHSIEEIAQARHKGGLIYLNTAHHPAAVGATFCHEIGHHLALDVLRRSDDRPVHYFFDAAYSSHLDDPVELTADVLVSIAAYPKSAARKMFSSEVAAIQEVSGRNLLRLLEYLKSGWGIDFQGPRQPGHHLIYLAGMVHYAKLRRALLTEYQI